MPTEYQKLAELLAEEKSAHHALQLQYMENLSDSKRRQNMDRCLLDVLEKERSLVTKLLYQMVPPKIARDLSNGVTVQPELYRYCVVFFSDIEGFTSFGNTHTPLQIFRLLDRLFSVMDYVTTCFPLLYKVETIGDAYMVVAGLEDSCCDEDEDEDEDEDDLSIEIERHYRERFSRCMFEFAILVNQAVQRMDMDSEEGRKVKVRVGLCGGPVLTGLCGNVTPRFCLFGDTVNTASRMESTGETSRVHIPQALADFIQKAPYADQYCLLERRTPIFVKGKGHLATLFLEPAPTRDILVEYAKELEHIDALCREASHAAESGGDRKPPHPSPFAALRGEDEKQEGRPLMPAIGKKRGMRKMNSDGSLSSLVSGRGSSLRSRAGSTRARSDSALSISSMCSDESSLRRRFAALEIKYRDSQLAKALGDEERAAAADLLVANEARATKLGNKNANLANALKQQGADRAREIAADVLLACEKMTLSEGTLAASNFRAKADSEAKAVLRLQEDKAAALFVKNMLKADAMTSRSVALALALSRYSCDTATALEVDQAIAAQKICDEEAVLFDDETSECFYNLETQKALADASELLGANAAVTAMVISMAKRQDARDQVDEEAEEEEAEMLDDASRVELETSASLYDDSAPPTPEFSVARATNRAEEMHTGILPITFEEFLSRDFDVLRMSPNQPLSITRAILIVVEGVVGDLFLLDVSQATFVRFLWKVGNYYHDVPYHNWHHAFCVVQSMAMLLTSTGQTGATEDGEKTNARLTPKELFIALLSAVIHDIDHRGLNNSFHNNSKSSLSLKYDAKSTLERHHIDVCFGIMKDASHNPLAHWTPEEQAKGRAAITCMVLKTDMGVHNDLTKILQARAGLPFDLTDEDDKRLYLEAMLHAADISNSVRSFAQSEILAMRLAVEFNGQTDKERQMGLPIASFMVQPSIDVVCVGEQGFLTYVAKPYWTALAECFEGQIAPELAMLNHNITCWRDLGDSVAKGPYASETLSSRLKRCSSSGEDRPSL